MWAGAEQNIDPYFQFKHDCKQDRVEDRRDFGKWLHKTGGGCLSEIWREERKKCGCEYLAWCWSGCCVGSLTIFHFLKLFSPAFVTENTVILGLLWWTNLRYVPGSCLKGSGVTAKLEPQRDYNLQIYCSSIIHSLLLVQVMYFLLFLLKSLSFTAHSMEVWNFTTIAKKRRKTKHADKINYGEMALVQQHWSSVYLCQVANTWTCPEYQCPPSNWGLSWGHAVESCLHSCVCIGTCVHSGSRDHCLQWEKFLPCLSISRNL